MIKRIIIFVLMSCICCGISAQKTATPGWKFHSLNQAGLLQGESVTALHLQTVNGFQLKNSFMGIGLGLDYYRYKSVPLFVSLRQYFGTTGNQFFVYTDAGVNFVWEKKTSSYNFTETYRPGFYGNAGIGYKAGFKNGMGLLLSTGYNYKRVTSDQETYTCGIVGPCYTQKDIFKYNLNRLIIQIGWMF